MSTTEASDQQIRSARSAPTRGATTTRCSQPRARRSPRAERRRRWRRSRAARRSGSARSTATSRPARSCSRRSTSTRSRSSAAPPPTSPNCRPGRRWSGWLHRFVGYMATKQALAQELLELRRSRRRPLPQLPRGALRRRRAAARARAGGRVVRADTDLDRGHPDGRRDREDPIERAWPDRSHSRDRARRAALPGGRHVARH